MVKGANECEYAANVISTSEWCLILIKLILPNLKLHIRKGLYQWSLTLNSDVKASKLRSPMNLNQQQLLRPQMMLKYVVAYYSKTYASL